MQAYSTSAARVLSRCCPEQANSTLRIEFDDSREGAISESACRCKVDIAMSIDRYSIRLHSPCLPEKPQSVAASKVNDRAQFSVVNPNYGIVIDRDKFAIGSGREAGCGIVGKQ